MGRLQGAITLLWSTSQCAGLLSWAHHRVRYVSGMCEHAGVQACKHARERVHACAPLPLEVCDRALRFLSRLCSHSSAIKNARLDMIMSINLVQMSTNVKALPSLKQTNNNPAGKQPPNPSTVSHSPER